MKRSIVLLLCAVVGLTGILPANAKDAWIPETDPLANSGFQVDWEAGNDLLLVLEEGALSTTHVFARNSRGDHFVCPEPGPALDCGVTGAISFGGNAILPACEGRIENCIEGIEVSSSQFSASPAVFTGSAPGFKFSGAPGVGAPRGAGPVTFQSEVPNSSGLATYAVIAAIGFDVFRNSGSQPRFQANELSLRIFAVSEKRDRGGMVPIVEVSETPDGKGMAPSIGGSPGCVYQEVGMCAVEQEFAEGTKFEVTLILSNQISGWFRGRLKDPVIDVQPIDNRFNRVIVSGDSVEVPRFLAQFSLASGDPDIVGPPNENSHGGSFTHFGAASERAIEIVQGMRSRVGDRATGISRVWSMNSISADSALQGQGREAQCLADKSRLLGVVTTNAMTYTGIVPEFKDGFLSYKVGGLHYAPDGRTLNLGTYDIVMRSDVARCLYGYSSAPVSATVAVIGEDGAENIATTVVSEKDGWLKLAAYGFTFSEKEIQVKISQPFQRALSDYAGRATALTTKQRAEIRSAVTRGAGNSRFICTGIRLEGQPMSMNRVVRQRAKLACDYAKSLNPEISTFSQTKTTQARSFNGRVLVVSK